MKLSEEILESSGELIEYFKFYLDRQLYHARLETSERMAKIVSSMITAAVVSTLALLVLVFFTVGVGLYLSHYWQSPVLGFGVIALFYGVLVLGVWVFRRQLITNPVVSLVIEKMFD